MKVVVVGAGIAGLMAGRSLHDRGHQVVLFDKGRSVGGRLATRRIAGARLDHGAQFFTVRSERLGSMVDAWKADGLVHVWADGFGPTPDGHPRYAVRGGMNALAKRVAEGLDVRTDSLVFGVDAASGAEDEAAWRVRLDDGSHEDADALIVTCPLPQSYSMLIGAGVQVPDTVWRTDYDRTIALLAVLDRPPSVPPPGAVQAGPADHAFFSFIADNVAKGVSDVPAVTFHANGGWSLEQWDTDRTEVHAALIEQARPWLGDAAIVASEVKRWRFATPQRLWPEPCWTNDDPGRPLALAGDAFAGPASTRPNLEGAALSGLAAADAIIALAG